MKNKRTLIGVFTSPVPEPFSDVKEVIEKLNLKEGTVVGVEYSLHHNYRGSITEQDVFWKKLIKHLEGKKCKIVFLDSEQLRSQMDSIQRKKKKLTLTEARVMYNDREKVFMERIPGCEFSFLGADHAIRLGKKAKADVFLDLASFIMYKKGLLALSPNQVINPAFINKRKKEHNRLKKKQALKKPKQKKRKATAPKRPLRHKG